MKVDLLHNLSYKEEFEGNTSPCTAAYIKVREDASLGSTYTADTSKTRSQISGEPAQRIKIREHRRIPKFDVPNLEVSKVYKLPLEGGYTRSLIKPVIMAGGNGKRLWPLSSKNKPKQFKKILSDLTLLQQTLNRNKFLGKPTIITSKKYELITKEQASEINVEIELITEPLQKNTAICAIITALSAKAQGFDIVVLLTSDHHIVDDINYLNTINKALHYVNKYGICTVGIPINSINTEYGYIKTGFPIAENIYLVDHFIEKPIVEQAAKYFQNKEYFWNSGIFIYDTSFFLNLAMNLQPDLFCIAEKAFNSAIQNEDTITINRNAYNEIEAISIDSAIMEYISGMVMIKADFAWNDLGTWHSLLQVKQQNINDNYCEGNVLTSNTTNSFISSNNKLTTVIGLDNVIIIDTMNGLLVADKSKMTEIKELVMKIEQN